MNFSLRLIERILIFSLSTFLLWGIATEIFEKLDQRLPLFFALIFTYILTAYVIFPHIIHFSHMIFRRGRIPRVTKAADGLPADIVNIILVGTFDELQSAFSKVAWHQADKLSIVSIWKMIKNFVLNKPYPNAPFSRLYLFGRKQDIGFQEEIGNSPRKRNHVRFWAANIDPRKELTDITYWLHKHPVDISKSNYWVGAGSEDIGFGLKKFSYQISHRTDKDVDKQRDYILNILRKNNCISDEHYIEPGELVAGKYISDGKIVWAKLAKIKN